MMEKSFDYIKDNYLSIKENMDKAYLSSPNKEKVPILLAATKTVDVDKINYAISLGLDHIGENRVQEMLSKYDSLNLKNCENHFIGRLQSNKIKYLIDKVNCIHSIDSMSQVIELSRLLEKNNSQMDILIEVNIGNEENKGGVKTDEIYEFVHQASEFTGVKIKGLMCIPPISNKKSEKMKYFSEMYKYYVDIEGKKLDNISMSILSMGMSDDYEEAIISGANLVRVGSSIFGYRNYV